MDGNAYRIHLSLSEVLADSYKVIHGAVLFTPVSVSASQDAPSWGSIVISAPGTEHGLFVARERRNKPCNHVSSVDIVLIRNVHLLIQQLIQQADITDVPQALLSIPSL